MKQQHLACDGNHLQRVLADLEAKGCLVESIDVLAGKRNSAYQINFIDRVEISEPKNQLTNGSKVQK